MTDTTAAAADVGHSASPTLRFQQALQTRIALIEAEISSIEEQFAETQTRLDQWRERRESADAMRDSLLQSISEYGPEEITSAFNEQSGTVVEVALAEQRLEELGDRRAISEDRLQTTRADLEMVEDVIGDLGPTSPEDNASLRSASRQVFQVIEEERMRIARDMHDGPAQSMSNLVMQAEVIERLADRPDALLVELQDFKKSVRDALDETRRLIFDLRPMTLDDLGLVPTLRNFTREYTKKHGIDIRLSAVGGDRRLPKNIEGTLFRIVQEALTNVQKHAHAQTVEVSLNLSPDRASATVRDDGRGFDVRAIQERVVQNRNLGLIIMRERCELERGVFTIKSRPGKGTEIQAEFKLE